MFINYSIIFRVPEYLLESGHRVKMFIEFLELVFHFIVIYILINIKLISKYSFIESIIGHENDNKRDCSNNSKKSYILALINLHPEYRKRIQKHIYIHNLL